MQRKKQRKSDGDEDDEFEKNDPQENVDICVLRHCDRTVHWNYAEELQGPGNCEKMQRLTKSSV